MRQRCRVAQVISTHTQRQYCISSAALKMAPCVQAWLQRFAWTERKLERRKKVRNNLPADRTLLSQEPMFCFETAVKLLFWCGFVYEYSEAGRMVRSTPLPPPPPALNTVSILIFASCPPLRKMEHRHHIPKCPMGFT